MKIANDIRWLGSGPRAGIGEIDLPAVQPGSSIMPGKVNPVIAELLLHGLRPGDRQRHDHHLAASRQLRDQRDDARHGLQPAAIDRLLAAAARNFTEQCVKGIAATARGPEMVERGLAICTALAPLIGYDDAANISKEAYKTGKTVREVAREKTNLSDEELDRILNPANMTKPGLDA